MKTRHYFISRLHTILHNSDLNYDQSVKIHGLWKDMVLADDSEAFETTNWKEFNERYKAKISN